MLFGSQAARRAPLILSALQTAAAVGGLSDAPCVGAAAYVGLAMAFAGGVQVTFLCGVMVRQSSQYAGAATDGPMV